MTASTPISAATSADQLAHRAVARLDDQVLLVGLDLVAAEQRRDDRARPGLVGGQQLDRRVLGAQLAHRPLDDDPALVDDRRAVADLLDLVQQVRGEEDRGAAGAELAHQLAHVLHALRVEAAGGLVEDHELGRVDERVGDAEALLHAVRVVADLGVGALAQADDVEHLVDARLVDSAVEAAHEAQVLARAHVAVEGRHLDEAADVAQGLLLVARHLMVEHLGVAAGRVDEADDHADGRRLAGPVGAEEAEDVAAAHGEAEVVDGERVAEALGEVVRGEHDRRLVREAGLVVRRSARLGCPCEVVLLCRSSSRRRRAAAWTWFALRTVPGGA